MINEQTLKLYVYVDGVNDVPFLSNDYQEYILSNGEQFVTSDGKVFNVRILNENIVIHAFTYNAKRMGSAPTITTTIKYPECLDELFSQKVYATFNGEKYFLVATPSSSYSNEEIMYKHEATFVSERIALENTYFYDVVPENAVVDEPVSNNSDFVLSCDIEIFATRMNYSLQYAGLQVVDENGEYVSGYKVEVDKGITSDEKFMSVENKFFSEVLQEVYNTYDLPYYFVGKEIHIGYSTNAISEVFRYGDSDALVSITKSNANNRIINRATGIGSEENIPYYYPNVSPEGDIKVELDTANTGLTSLDDIRITNYELFAKNLIMNQVAELFPSTQTVIRPFDFYSFFQDRVLRSIRTEPNKLSNKVTTTGKGESTTYQISYNITNVDKTFIGDAGYLDQVLPNSVSWATLGDMRPSGVLPTLSVIKCNGTEEDLSKFKVLALRVYWIIEKFSTDYVDDSYNFDVIKTQELTFNDKYGYYEYPNFNEALDYVESESLVRDDMGASTIKFEWDIVAPAVEYEIEVGFEVSDFVNPVWKVNNNVVQLQNIGVAIDSTPQIGDKFQKVLGENGWINPQKTLMPPIYRESLGAQRFYDAVSGIHIIPDENGLDSGLKYEFENEYNGHNPKEQIVQFEEIKPTIKEMRNSEGLRIDMFSEIAFDENDNDEMYETPDGTMEYKHPVFFAKLRKLDFNLFDSAIDSGEMTIAMTDGSCGACEFKVAVSKEGKKNTVQVDENGDLVRYDDPDDEHYGEVKCNRPTQTEEPEQDKQQDTINNEVWIALYKDKDTFGEIMPSMQNNLVPKACSTPTENDGDTFVILHISLPQAYIEYAEKQLEQQIIYFMYDNNREKFNFSIKFSRIYFAEHPEILALLDENARITVEYNDIETQLYVSSITYKATENDILPEITVELKDEVTVTQNQVQKATNQLKSEIYRTLYGIDTIAQGTRVFLRKDQPDTALQPITFKSNTNLDGGATVDKKIESKDYFEGSKGLSIHKDENNQWHIETDYLHARKKFSAKEVEIQKVYHISGAQIKSSASMICSRVADLGDSYRCWFDANDDDRNIIYNQFIVGDQAYVRTFNLVNDNNGNTTNHFYWRLVEAVDANSITLSKTNCAEGSTPPMVGDNIVQLGYQRNDRPERQVAVIDAGAGEGAPYYRQFVGINSFALPEPETQLKPNDNILTGRVVMQAGSNGLENFNEWESKQNEIDYSRNYIDNVLPNTLDELRAQIDGQVESYFEDYDPTTTNYPASEWTTDELKEAHIGDTFTNTQVYVDDVTTPNAGKSWRWLNKDGAYGWYAISDTDALKALALAQQAKDTADGKRRVFVVQPTPPYDKGDLWAGGSHLPLKRCVFSRTSGEYVETDWELADYSDKTQTVIDNGIITSGTIQLGDSDTTAKAGVTGSGTSDDSVRIWAGDGEDNKENAPFRVLQDGTMYASKGMFKGSIDVNDGVFSVDKDGKVIAENAEVRGIVQAKSGTFENGIFENVTLNGSVSSPFVEYIGAQIAAENGVTYTRYHQEDKMVDIGLSMHKLKAWVHTQDNTQYVFTISEKPKMGDDVYSVYVDNDRNKGTIISTIKEYINKIDGANGINKHDNLVLPISKERELSPDELTWDVTNSGRLIRLVHADFDNTTSTGKVLLIAPDGQYFYEDGEKYPSLVFSREIIELFGFGTSDEFYGWIVLNRKSVDTTNTYGSPLNVIYQGVIRERKVTKIWSPSIQYGKMDILPPTWDASDGILVIPYHHDYRGLSDTNNWEVIVTNGVVKAKNTGITTSSSGNLWNTIRVQIDVLSGAENILFQVISTADWLEIP